MAAGLLPIIVAQLTRQYPGISIHVTQSPIGSLEYRTPQYRDLRERNVDLVLGTIVRPLAEDNLQAERLFDDDSVVAAGSENRWVRNRAVRLADLVDEAWCLPPPDTPVGSRCIDAFRACGVDMPQRAVIAVSVQLQIGLLATGRYLTMFPTSLMWCSARRFAIKALPIELPLPPIHVGIVTLKNRTVSPAAQLFVQTAREVAKPMVKSNKRR